MRRTLAIIGALVVILLAACDGAGEKPSKEMKLSPRGSLGFWFHIDSDYYNGVKPQGDYVMLMEIPETMTIELDTPSITDAAAAQPLPATVENAAVRRETTIEYRQPGMQMAESTVPSLYLHLDHLPGPAWYYLAYRWDSTQGIFDGFLNGVPLQTPGTKFVTWAIAEKVVAPVLAAGVEDFELSGDFWPDDRIESTAASREHVDMRPASVSRQDSPRGC